MFEQLLGSRVKIKILLEVGRKPYSEFYLNELARELNLGLGRTKEILDDLTKLNILVKRKSGNRILFKLNENNQLSFEVVKIANFNALTKINEEFRTAITNFSNACQNILGDNLTSIAVFGSVAKGKPTKYSDIDILILVKKTLGKKIKEELHKKFFDILDVFSKVAEEKIFTEKEFLDMYQIGNDFLINIMKDGIVVLDKNNFYSKALVKGLPKITKKAIENRVNIAKKWLDGASETYKNNPEIVTSELGIISNHLSRALLLLNNVLPQSKHEIASQLKYIGENKFAKIYSKTRDWFDSPPLKANKEEVWEILNFLKEKYNYCIAKLEEWA